MWPRQTSLSPTGSLPPPDRPKFRFSSFLPYIFCGEGEDVVGVHTLLRGVVQVCHELLVGEEEEKEEEQGRQEERELERGSQGEETAHMDDYGDGVKCKTQT